MGNIFTINVSCDTIFSNCTDCTVGKATYISELEDNLVALQTAMEKLVEAGNDVRTRVVIAEQKNMERLNQVQGWLSRVQAMEVEVGKLLRDGSQEIEKLYLGGFCSKNCKSSYRLGKKVNKMLQAVATLTSEGDFKAVAERIPEAAVDERPIDPTIVGLQANVDEVWRCLGEERVGILGLYGMGGVGKTTLLTQINNRFLNTPNDFDLVIWVLVSKDLQLEKIQDTIGNKLGFCDESWKRNSITDKSADIFRVLSKKKFVLLLDDIWERVDLTKVGVPLPSPKIASKVVFTTRFIDVCGLMEAHKYKVECLNHDEAWKLFQTKVGEDILYGHPDIPELAETVARECCGLPLALITIGRAMAYKKTPEEWSYAIQVLRSAAFNFPGMETEVYRLLKFSYDSLPSNKIRACLLYCSLYPEDYKIPKSELIDCWIGEGYLDGTDKLYEGYYILGILLHACLLEEEEENYVKMHDVIRDMTLWIACEIEKERENFLVQAGTGLTEAPEIGKWECVKKISLMENEIENLPRSPACPILQTLFLSRNDLKVISNDFFQFMPSLILLNLSHNRFLTILPLGISKLVSLQHLDLSGTSIRELPKDLIALVNLKCLNLEETAHLNAIPRHLISQFSMLHVLRMLACGFARHTGEDSVLCGGSKFLVEELFGLKHLNVLSITLTSSHALQMLLTSHMLQSCTQALCLRFVDSSKSLKIVTLANLKHLNKVQILNCNNLEDLKIDCDGEIQEIRMNHGFRSLHTILIDSCLRLRDVTWLILAPNVKIIRISSCPSIVEVINVNALDEVSMKIEELNVLSKLEFLELANLGRLGRICKTALPFSHLKEIRVVACPELKMLPLDYNTKPNIIIRGEGFWWRRLIWEDLVIENAFLPCFIPYS